MFALARRSVGLSAGWTASSRLTPATFVSLRCLSTESNSAAPKPSAETARAPGASRTGAARAGDAAGSAGAPRRTGFAGGRSLSRAAGEEGSNKSGNQNQRSSSSRASVLRSEGGGVSLPKEEGRGPNRQAGAGNGGSRGLAPRSGSGGAGSGSNNGLRGRGGSSQSSGGRGGRREGEHSSMRRSSQRESNDFPKGGASSQDVAEVVTRIIHVDRVARMTRQGRRVQMRSLVVVGNGQGAAGFGAGKGKNVTQALESAMRSALKDMVTIERAPWGGLYHDVMGKLNNTRVMIRSTSTTANRSGVVRTAVVAGPVVHAVLDCFGVTSAVTKVIGRSNPFTVVAAAFHALGQHTSPQQAARIKNMRVVDISDPREAFADEVLTNVFDPDNPTSVPDRAPREIMGERAWKEAQRQMRDRDSDYVEGAFMELFSERRNVRKEAREEQERSESRAGHAEQRRREYAKANSSPRNNN